MLEFFKRLGFCIAIIPIGLAIFVGAIEIGNWWFFAPDEPTITIDCNDDGEYEYTDDDDSTLFKNDEGHTCVKKSDTETQTRASYWEWPQSISLTSALVMALITGFVAFVGIVVFLAGIFLPWDNSFM